MKTPTWKAAVKFQTNKKLDWAVANFFKRRYTTTCNPTPDTNRDIDLTGDSDSDIFNKTTTPLDTTILFHTSNTLRGEDKIQYMHIQTEPQILLQELSTLYTASFQIVT